MARIAEDAGYALGEAITIHEKPDLGGDFILQLGDGFGMKRESAPPQGATRGRHALGTATPAAFVVSCGTGRPARPELSEQLEQVKNGSDEPRTFQALGQGSSSRSTMMLGL